MTALEQKPASWAALGRSATRPRWLLASGRRPFQALHGPLRDITRSPGTGDGSLESALDFRGSFLDQGHNGVQEVVVVRRGH